MVEWMQSNNPILWWLAASSIVTLLISVVAGPWWAIHIPADYFKQQDSDRKKAAVYTLGGIVLKLGKNLLGTFLIIGGLVMLVLPGQGVLPILIGIMLTDFPGKHRVAIWLVARPPVLRSLNWIRRRAHKPPLIVD